MLLNNILSENELRSLNLTGKKGDIYTVLLNNGNLGAADIATLAGLKRTTVYDLLLDLYNLGLIDINMNGSKKTYRARSPKNLLSKAQENLKLINNILPKLQKIYENTPGKPRFRYFEGMEGYIQINKELLELNKGDEYFYFDAGMSMIDRMGTANLQQYVKKRIEKGIWSNSIRVKESEIDATFLKGSPHNLRRVRFFPKKINSDFTAIYIYNNKVGLVPTKSEAYSMIIDSPELAFSMKILWDVIWDISLLN